MDVVITVSPCPADAAALRTGLATLVEEFLPGRFDTPEQMQIHLLWRWWGGCEDGRRRGFGSGYWPQIETVLRYVLSRCPTACVEYGSDVSVEDDGTQLGTLVTEAMLAEHRREWDMGTHPDPKT